MAHLADLWLDFASGGDQLQLRLCDPQGATFHQRALPLSLLPQGEASLLFAPYRHFYYYVPPDYVAAEQGRLGHLLAQRMLGEEIMAYLAQGQEPRTLRVHVTANGNALTRREWHWASIPWDQASASGSAGSLAERNVRLVLHVPPAIYRAVRPADAPLRVLMLFADTGHTARLGLRHEQRQLQQLFEREIYPHRQVEWHTLSHGVTRVRLQAQLDQYGGYDVLHWNGAGRDGCLCLATVDGKTDALDKAALLDLFRQAGVDLPKLWWISHSDGHSNTPHSWADFFADARLAIPQPPPPHPHDMPSLAHALATSGVPALIVMRHPASATYAHELALGFYRALWGGQRTANVADALAQARRAPGMGSDHWPTDALAPMLIGSADLDLAAPPGRSAALEQREICLPRLPALTDCPHFAGRVAELSRLGRDWLGGTRPVAQLRGLGGMGKTSLISEVMALWERRFDWVLMFQAGPQPMTLEALLTECHYRLLGEEGVYYSHLKKYPAAAIFRPISATFDGDLRITRLRQNLLRALQDEAILLILDNFETCLSPEPAFDDENGQYWACQDVELERAIAEWAAQLGAGRSRVLITTRRPLAALARVGASGTLNCVLGALPLGEARILVQQHLALAKLAAGDANERVLLQRILAAARLHPLLTDRMGRMAAEPEQAGRLGQMLALLEQKLGDLPDLFAASAPNRVELAYLDDALQVSVQQLIASLPDAARHLLWMVAVADEPIENVFLESAWSGQMGEPEGRQAGQARLQAMIQTSRCPWMAGVCLGYDEVLQVRPTQDYPQHADPMPLPLLLGLGLIDSVTSDGKLIYCHDYVKAAILDWASQHEAWSIAALTHFFAARLAGAAMNRFCGGNLQRAGSVAVRALRWARRAQQPDLLLVLFAPLGQLPLPRLRDEILPELANWAATQIGNARLTLLHASSYYYLMLEDWDAAADATESVAALLAQCQDHIVFAELQYQNTFFRAMIAGERTDYDQAMDLLDRSSAPDLSHLAILFPVYRLRWQYLAAANKAEILQQICAQALPDLDHTWGVAVQSVAPETSLTLTGVAEAVFLLTGLLADTDLAMAEQLYWVATCEDMMYFLQFSPDRIFPVTARRCELLRELGRVDEAQELLEYLQPVIEANPDKLLWFYIQRVLVFVKREAWELALRQATLARLIALQTEQPEEWAKWNELVSDVMFNLENGQAGDSILFGHLLVSLLLFAVDKLNDEAKRCAKLLQSRMVRWMFEGKLLAAPPLRQLVAGEIFAIETGYLRLRLAEMGESLDVGIAELEEQLQQVWIASQAELAHQTASDH